MCLKELCRVLIFQLCFCLLKKKKKVIGVRGSCTQKMALMTWSYIHTTILKIFKLSRVSSRPNRNKTALGNISILKFKFHCLMCWILWRSTISSAALHSFYCHIANNTQYQRGHIHFLFECGSAEIQRDFVVAAAPSAVSSAGLLPFESPAKTL